MMILDGDVMKACSFNFGGVLQGSFPHTSGPSVESRYLPVLVGDVGKLAAKFIYSTTADCSSASRY